MSNVSREGCCTEPGCVNPIEARRLCKAHYLRNYREQNPEKQEALNAARRKATERRTCPVDGTVFEAANNKRYCSIQCKKRAENAGRYGWDPSSVPLLAPFSCAHCGEHCIPGENVAPHATRFCGHDCKAAWHKALELRGLVLSSVTEGATPYQIVNYRRAMRADPCAYCGGPGGGRDHIVPRANGGEDDWTNYTGVCQSCNSLKWTMPLLLFLGYRAARVAWEPWQQASRALRVA